MNQVIALKALKDNYIWVIQNKSQCIIVDPGETSPVFAYLGQNKNIQPIAILVTHYHWDHTDGIAEIKQKYPNIKVYGPANSPYKHFDHELNEGDELTFKSFNLSLFVWHTPGHTLDHIVYFNEQWLFCGDTLFSGGCGRMFEGSPKQFLTSLDKLSILNDSTKVFCTHEYTQANLKFANYIEPENQQLKAYTKQVDLLRQQQKITLPSTIKLEKQINPFLRYDQQSVQKRISQLCNQEFSNLVQYFAALRTLKDKF